MSNNPEELFQDALFAYRQKRHQYTRPRQVLQRLKGGLRQIAQKAAVLVAGMGFDISAWQNTVNYEIAKSRALKFVWIRGLNGLTIDSRFASHWNGGKGKVKRGVYLYYREDRDPVLQAQKLREICGDDPGELPPMLDIEEVGNETLTAARIKLCAEELTRQFGVKPVIYTGFYVWRDSVTGNKAWASAYPLVIAAYPLVGWNDNYPTLVLNYPPMIPAPWTKFFAWQWTAYAPADEYGVSGVYLDLEYASPEMAALYLDETHEENNFMINFKTLYSLVTRAEGRYGAPITGSLPINTVFTALDINIDTPTSIWLKYAEGQWVALVHANIKRCERVGVVPCEECEECEEVPMTPVQEALLYEVKAKVDQMTTLVPTHRVNRPTGSGQIKGRGIEDGEELIDLKHGTLMQFIHAQDSSKYVRIMIGAFPHIVAVDEGDWANYVVINS